MPVKKTTILTADDDPQLLRLVARNLELEGYDVLVASDWNLILLTRATSSPRSASAICLPPNLMGKEQSDTDIKPPI